MATIRFIIADDHKIFREGLRLVLSDDASLQFVAEAENGEELLQILKGNEADVILLDLKMPVMDGMTATKEIRAQYPDVKILILTMHDEEHMILHMLEAGANGYLLKNADPSEIKKAIFAVTENNYYFNDMVSGTMLKNIMNKNIAVPTFKPVVELDERETKILQLICQECTSAEIGDKIFLSARTVEGLRAGMMEKVGVRNIAGLVMYAVKNGIAQ
jgi:DNA-binding NarL/FixJ family response regulator